MGWESTTTPVASAAERSEAGPGAWLGKLEWNPPRGPGFDDFASLVEDFASLVEDFASLARDG